MGVGRRAPWWLPSLLALGFAGLAGASIAWHQALIAGVCGVVALGARPKHARLALAMGLAAATAAAPAPAQALAAALALAVAAAAWAVPPVLNADADDSGAGRTLRHAALIALGLGVVLACKQGIAARVLPVAISAVPRAGRLGLSVAAACWVAAALPQAAGIEPDEGSRGQSIQAPQRPPLSARLRSFFGGFGDLALALLLVGCASVGRLTRLTQLPAPARLAAAVPIDAVPLVLTGVIAESRADPATLRAVLLAAPDADAAALALGWEAALAAGWRPQRADGVVIEVARALERAGRGGEAIRLLAKHPRVGEVDALRTLFERTQALPEDWRGGRLGPVIGSQTGSLCDRCFLFMHNESREIEFTTLADAFDAWLVVGCDGAAYEGQPELTLTLDGQLTWVVTCPAEAARTQIWLAPGPHRLRLAFENDREGPGGDRNLGVTSLTVLPG